MTLPILYSFRRCPYAMRARMALILANKQVELREILLKDKPNEMLAISSKGTVPVLQLTEKVLDESLEIISWAMELHPANVYSASDDEQLISNNLNTMNLSEKKIRKIANDSQKLEKLNKSRPNSFLLRVFFDAKADEISDVFSDGPSVNIAKLVSMLNKVAPTHSNKWKNIKF